LKTEFLVAPLVNGRLLLEAIQPELHFRDQHVESDQPKGNCGDPGHEGIEEELA
jgi:hypothetical protein